MTSAKLIFCFSTFIFIFRHIVVYRSRLHLCQSLSFYRMTRALGVIILCFVFTDAYKILVYSPKFGHSHSNFMGRIADVLTEEGHVVVSSGMNHCFLYHEHVSYYSLHYFATLFHERFKQLTCKQKQWEVREKTIWATREPVRWENAPTPILTFQHTIINEIDHEIADGTKLSKIIRIVPVSAKLVLTADGDFLSYLISIMKSMLISRAKPLRKCMLTWQRRRRICSSWTCLTLSEHTSYVSSYLFSRTGII